MAISLLCPNGHRLTCPDDRVGKGGKCPICGATFRVPSLAEAGTAAGKTPPPMPRLVEGRGDGSHPNLQAVEAAAAPVGAINPIKPYDEHRDPPPNPHELVFLCPEGHHLRGPESLVEQPGTCPICRTQFLVPSPYDDDEGDEHVPTAKVEQSLDQFLSSMEGGDGSANGAALGPLFAQLWSLKQQGVTIELHLGDGKLLTPEGFNVDSAHHSHGIFLSRDSNGSNRLSVVAWSTVQFVAVRGLRQLPGGMEFDVRG